ALGLVGVGPVAGDLVDEVGAGHLRGRAHAGEELLDVGGARGDADPHGAGLAQVPGEGAGVAAADADDALGGQFVLEAALGAPVRGDAGGVADDVAGDPDPAGLVVLVVPAGVADLGGGLGDDLPVVGGVGEGLLVAGHAGVEDGFAEG